MIVLAYIQSDSRRFKTFVANCVSLIRENSLRTSGATLMVMIILLTYYLVDVMLAHYLQFGSRVLGFCLNIRVRGRFSRLLCRI